MDAGAKRFTFAKVRASHDGMSLSNEAHLPLARRTVGVVRYLPRPRRSCWGWAVFAGVIVLNECRGTYVAATFLAQFFKALHGH